EQLGVDRRPDRGARGLAPGDGLQRIDGVPARGRRAARLGHRLHRDLDAHVERLARAGVDDPHIAPGSDQNAPDLLQRVLVGPGRDVRIVDAGARKALDVRIEVPVESMAEPGGAPAAGGDPVDPLEPVAGGEATRASIWPAIYPELL